MTVRVKRRICISSVLSVLAVAYFGHSSFNPGLMVDVSTKLLSSPKLDDDGGGIIPEASKCTESELNTIRYQLPPDDCIKNRGTPFNQRCSMTYATKCPDSVWFDNYYTKLHLEHHNNQNSNNDNATPFLAIFVGCNKGFDAVNAMRMGSGNSFFDKKSWRDAMSDNGKVELQSDVCNQATSPQFQLPESNNSTKKDRNIDGNSAIVHCIEPMPNTVYALKRSASITKYDQNGLIVTHAAISKENGSVLFAKKGVGIENQGISNGCGGQNICENVTMYSLDTYVEKFVQPDGGRPINYLSIDVEGWDYQVILGGRKTLKNVHYLEFEYNWMGPWAKQPLSQAIKSLYNDYGFICYWPGFNNTIWRITNCWLEHYDIHFWSNVACVNRNIEEVREIADSMEGMFMDTMMKGGDAVRDYEHRFQRVPSR